DHAVTKIFKDISRQLSQSLFIVSDKNSLAAAGRGRYMNVGAFGHLFLHSGKEDLECGSPTRFAINIDVAAMLFNDAIGHCQTEPGTLIDILGRKKGLEDAAEVLRFDAGTRIAHDDLRISTRFAVGILTSIILVQFDGTRLDSEASAG